MRSLIILQALGRRKLEYPPVTFLIIPATLHLFDNPGCNLQQWLLQLVLQSFSPPQITITIIIIIHAMLQHLA